MDRLSLLLAASGILFTLGVVGVIVRRNALVMLMCLELMLNAVVLSLVAFSAHRGEPDGAVLAFLVFVVATAEIAIAIPIVMLLARQRHTLDVQSWDELKG
jgi:NADH-quinone oxidoreductase subunit K